MKLKHFRIQNFRGISDLELDLDDTTVLVGENNVGKSSVLEALHLSFSRGLSRKSSPFTSYDFFLTEAAPTPDLAPPILLTLTFAEDVEGEWPEQIGQALDTANQVLEDGRSQVRLRIRCAYDPVIEDLAVEWEFLDLAENPLPRAKNPRLLSDLQTLAPVFLLGAVREAAQHFGSRSAFWGPFTKNPRIEPGARKEIEAQIEQINQTVLDNHEPFGVVKARLSEAKKLVSLADGDLVSMEAVPARIYDMLAKTQVKISARSGCRLPVAQHGAGTQSLSVLFLFEAFLNSRLAQAYDAHSVPILALEEPESHLHPSAIRALWPSINGFAGQKIIATHSGDLLAAVPLRAVRRLARRNGNVKVFRVQENTLSPDELNKVAYHVRAKRGALMFARCWVLVEGETEFTMLPEIARIMGHDFELLGISCVEFSQCDVRPLIKVAKDLGIEWHVLADGDSSGQEYATFARGLFDAGETDADRVTSLIDKDIEHCMWAAGLDGVYEAAVTPHYRKSNINAQATDPLYRSQVIKGAIKGSSKPALAYSVVAELANRGPSAVPTAIRSLIDKVVELAGRAA